MNSSLSNDHVLQRLEAQQELFQNINRIRNICWDKCMSDGVDSYLSSRQEACITYCADRFVDAAIVLSNRYNAKLSGRA